MRMYGVEYLQVAATAQQDLFEVTAGTDTLCTLYSIDLSQGSEAGDAEDEQLTISICIHDSDSTSGSGGSSYTPTPLDAGGGPAAASAAEVNNTTKVTGGTTTAVKPRVHAFNVRAGLPLVLPPDERIQWTSGQRLAVELEKTPADSITMNGTLTFGEQGGTF